VVPVTDFNQVILPILTWLIQKDDHESPSRRISAERGKFSWLIYADFSKLLLVIRGSCGAPDEIGWLACRRMIYFMLCSRVNVFFFSTTFFSLW